MKTELRHCPHCPHSMVLKSWNHRPRIDKAVGMLSDLHMRVTLARIDDDRLLENLDAVIKELKGE